MHDEDDVLAVALSGQPALEPVHVEAEDRRAVRVRDRGRRPLELRRLGEDVGRERDVEAGHLLEQDLADAALVRRVHVRVDQADGDGLELAGLIFRATSRTDCSSSGVTTLPA
ncbi:MAG: hypothetical protein R3C15_17535 [Thermoleophilia bacterium]